MGEKFGCGPWCKGSTTLSSCTTALIQIAPPPPHLLLKYRGGNILAIFGALIVLWGTGAVESGLGILAAEMKDLLPLLSPFVIAPIQITPPNVFTRREIVLRHNLCVCPSIHLKSYVERATLHLGFLIFLNCICNSFCSIL